MDEYDIETGNHDNESPKQKKNKFFPKIYIRCPDIGTLVCIACGAFMFFIIMGLIYIVISIHKQNVMMEKQDYEHLLETKKTVVRSGYWQDKGMSCSVQKPCIMNCEEYSRFEVDCSPDNLTCHGDYDWCHDRPRGGQQGYFQ